MALKYAIDREAMVQTDPAGLRHGRQRLPDQRDLSLFPEGIEQRAYDPEKAAFHYKKSGHSGSILLRTSEVAFPGAVDAAVLYQQSAKKAGIDIEVKREPGDGYWTNVWNKQPFCASYWGGRPTQDGMYSTAYLSRRPTGTTRASSARTSTSCCSRRAPSSTRPSARSSTATMAVMVRDEGGLILPMFNDFMNASTKT